ncbi:baseplate J/gp47 family protein [Brevibacillus choshinensis]|uniref:Baseplate J/gp47 family protein n=1 Tax=Brevibacillus choshinensis TaxID=54911 RepID=A0ABX7FSD3_BRECH|nr:baseplate J/gp47 family protein [Brevibacillus choshinensis]QRG68609.1 baseplate J/gp47 family protein [Brevibacillus choshinensis]
MATIVKPEMPILRESPDAIYQRLANKLIAIAEARGEAPPATEEGEIFYDLLYPIAEEISEQQQLLEYAFLQAFLPWADGVFLDAHGAFLGLTRKDGELDDPYRDRLIERAQTEEGNGRANDYAIWARAVNGVGGATAVEKARNDLSIDVYITDINGQPATQAFAEQVRTALEKKRIGLHDLKVLPATVFALSVSVKLTLQEGAVLADITTLLTTRIKEYLKGRSQLVYQQIAALFFVDGVVDFTNYTLNGGTANLTVPGSQVVSLNLVVTT